MVDQTAPVPTSTTPWGDGCPSENDIAGLAQGLVGPSLREQVIVHLDRCARCTALLAELAWVLAPASPRRIGRYEVVRQIGAGGMGVVFLAVDSELKRQVAIKLIRADLLDARSSSIRARLVREAQLLAALTHPNVVAVHDVGEVDGDVFIAMEYVDGQALSDWLWEQKPDPKRIGAAFEQAGQGLAAAHALDIVHRDVKPSNLLVGVDGRVRLTDFGLATIQRESSLPASSIGAETAGSLDARFPLTQAGTIVGTPAYMAPEQRAGQAGPLADQFSYCLCLYEALAGDRPVLRDDGWEVAPSRGPLAAAPAGIGDVVLRGLSLDPARRFESMTALLGATEWTADQTSAAPSPRRASSLPRGVALLATALIIAGALIAAALLLTSKPDAPNPPRAAASQTAGSTVGLDARAPSSAVDRRADASGGGPVAPSPSNPTSIPAATSQPVVRSDPAGSRVRGRVPPQGSRTVFPRRSSTTDPASRSAAPPRPSSPGARAEVEAAIPPLWRPLPVASPQDRRQARALIKKAYRLQKSGKGQACLGALKEACRLHPGGCSRAHSIQALCEMMLGRCKQGLARLARIKRRSIASRGIEERAGILCPTGGGPRVRLWRLLGQTRKAVRSANTSGCGRHGRALAKLVPQLPASLRSSQSFTVYTRLIQAACCLGKAGRCKQGWQLRYRAARLHLGTVSPNTVQKLQNRFYRCATTCRPP